MSAVRDYFAFSKRERRGIVILMILILIVFLLPEFIPSPPVVIDKKRAAEIQEQIASLNKKDTASHNDKFFKKNYTSDYYSTHHSNESGKLFTFDPNTLSEDGWKKLGINERTIRTIKKYISRGGRFREPADLGKIYGIHEDQYKRLLPYVRVNVPEQKNSSNEQHSNEHVYKKPEKISPSVVDLNTADTTELISLPGIGSKLANRIINFRDRLGGFHSIDQVKETYGLADSTYQKIKMFLRCDTSKIQKINLNTVDLGRLKNHPYIKWNLANTIINFRQEHGNYKSVDDLLRIDIISKELFEKSQPYFIVE
jgi:competence ComEA-like helix-hairpin-helix protein